MRYFLHESDPRSGIISRLFFIHFITPCACSSSSVKYYFKSFCMKIWARWPYIHLSVVFPSRMPAGPHCYAINTIKWKHSTIWHKSSTKHKEVRPDWNDKTIMHHAPRITWKVSPTWLRLPFLKKYSIKCEKIDCELFYSELKRHNVSHYIYYLATDNIHIVLENDNTVLIKGLKKVVNVKFSRNTHLIETSYDRLKSREITLAI